MAVPSQLFLEMVVRLLVRTGRYVPLVGHAGGMFSMHDSRRTSQSTTDCLRGFCITKLFRHAPPTNTLEEG